MNANIRIIELANVKLRTAYSLLAKVVADESTSELQEILGKLQQLSIEINNFKDKCQRTEGKEFSSIC